MKELDVCQVYIGIQSAMARGKGLDARMFCGWGKAIRRVCSCGGLAMASIMTTHAYFLPETIWPSYQCGRCPSSYSKCQPFLLFEGRLRTVHILHNIKVNTTKMTEISILLPALCYYYYVLPLAFHNRGCLYSEEVMYLIIDLFHCIFHDC